ncbi:MAG: hypothetical protein R6V49_04585 [Bacteroidales bacterium]
MNTTKRLRFILLLVFTATFATFDAVAQIIDEKEVAPAAMDLFNRKFRKSTEPVWEMKGNDYAVNFVFKAKKVYAEFERTGKLTVQRTEMNLEELKPNIQQYLKKKQKSQVVRKAEYVQEFPTKKYYYVEMVPKRYKDDEDAVVTVLYFSSTGVFQSTGEEKGGDEDGAEAEEKLEVPANVLKEFSRKVKKANEVEWMDVDTAYRADFKSGSNTSYALFAYEGAWIKTTMKMKAKFKNLHPGIQRYFAENMDDYTFLYAEDVTEAPNEKYFNVVILDNTDNPAEGEEIQPTQLHFTKSGKHVATFYPDYTVERYQKKVDKKWQKIANDENVAAAGGAVSDKDIDRKDLPTRAQDFLNKNYDNEWRTRVCRAIEDDTHGILYYVVMKKQGQNLSEEHYFDLHGNLIEDEDEE